MKNSLLFKSSTIIITLVVMYIWVSLVDLVMGYLINYHHSNYDKLTLSSFTFACVIAPLWEELAFRHLPAKISIIINRKLVWPILLMSCIIFGFGHGNGVMSLLYQGVLGLGFCWIYIVNKNNYWMAVITHGLWNLLCFVV